MAMWCGRVVPPAPGRALLPLVFPCVPAGPWQLLPGRVSFSFFVADGLAGWGRAPRRRRGAPDGEGARVEIEIEILEKVGRHRHGE